MKYHVRLWGGLAIAALTAVLTSCVDAPTAPTSQGLKPRADVGAGTGSGPVLHPNSRKYSDAGTKPSTGRAGLAVISARALLGKDGITTLDVTTGVLDETSAPGELSKIQVKLFTADNTTNLSVVNYNHPRSGGDVTYTYAGLGRNSRVQVQSNVRGIDPTRTDVVTVTPLVKLRPDLGVKEVSAPQKARPKESVNITATVSELNGDVGARANCVLAVDGSKVDDAPGIWVDAGSTVSCAFKQRFATSGTRKLTVSVTDVVPGDWDANNNSKSASIEIVDPEVKLFSQVSAYQYDYVYRSAYDTYWRDNLYGSPTGEFHSAQEYHYRDQRAYYSGYSTEATLEFPVSSFAIALTSDGNEVYSASEVNLEATYSWSDGDYAVKCVQLWRSGHNAQACSQSYYGSLWTSVSFNYYAGVVVYASSNWRADHYPSGTVIDGPYYWETTTLTGAAYTAFGSDLRFDVRLESGGTLFTASPTMTFDYVQPLVYNQSNCSDWYDHGYYMARDCYTYSQDGTYRWGYNYDG